MIIKDPIATCKRRPNSISIKNMVEVAIQVRKSITAPVKITLREVEADRYL